MAEHEAADAQRFGQLLRALRMERGLSLSQLAAVTYTHRGSIGNIENGKRLPDQRFVEIADAELNAQGQLTDAWNKATSGREARRAKSQLLETALMESRDIARLAEPSPVDTAGERTQHLAIQYLGTPPATILESAVQLRHEANAALQRGHLRPRDVSDTLATVGRLSGILAYATLDMGHPDAAQVHAQAAWRSADLANDGALKAWTRGTQSLILRFTGDNDGALRAAIDGQRYVRRGQALSRLLSAEAQCRAVTGDSRAANDLLDRAIGEVASSAAPDEAGIFGFAIEKQHYYVASSLVWLNGGRDADRAATGARTAIELWSTSDPHKRSISDAALAHVYLATAHLQLGEPEDAIDALRPILDLPESQQFSWIRKRLKRITSMLSTPPYTNSKITNELAERLADLLERDERSLRFSRRI
ncbi:helix-turn-helix domain-containing protein [Cryptosporangium sp. NPDC048952]|uniref:helix-turn-helix domain-containing protein n=1 Tax=Cryptosporangium sp. NPDC048952 TaxID=3363961 RepID=UPI00371E5989